jgi:hypothetical protein
MCVADGMPCTAEADCCGCACVADGAGGFMCSSAMADCGACTGANLGELCATDTDCCNNPVVICNDEAGVEFPTCVLAP